MPIFSQQLLLFIIASLLIIDMEKLLVLESYSENLHDFLFFLIKNYSTMTHYFMI